MKQKTRVYTINILKQGFTKVFASRMDAKEWAQTNLQSKGMVELPDPTKVRWVGCNTKEQIFILEEHEIEIEMEEA